jgi:hypothetical protein
MKSLKTYYWNDRVYGYSYELLKFWPWFNQHHNFRHGNAGDIFTADLIKYKYGVSASIEDASSRLLLVGSLMHRVQPGDVVCGIGSKFEHIENTEMFNGADILAVRGPLTYELLKKNNIDVSKVKSAYDPGLLAKYVYADQLSIDSERESVIFIPHYRERRMFEGFKRFPIVNIDASPLSVCRQIFNSDHVLTSSLHGLIFAHGLGVPATLVLPKTNEGLFKYKDYLQSVGVDFKPIEDVDNIALHNLKNSPENIKIEEKDIFLPSQEYLLRKNLYKN